MSVSQHIADLLQQDIAAAMKESIGFNDDIANSLAGSLMNKLQAKWGGREVYIPSLKSKDRNKLVKNDFNGLNHTEVCKKYDISLSTLYRVVK